jgi:hypothetical protein
MLLIGLWLLSSGGGQTGRRPLIQAGGPCSSLVGSRIVIARLMRKLSMVGCVAALACNFFPIFYGDHQAVWRAAKMAADGSFVVSHKSLASS